MYLIVVFLFTSFLNTASCDNNDTLEMVYAIFRHGEKTNEKTVTYEGYPYQNESYFPIGKGLLTNKGKKTAYNLGKNLRQIYTNFLNYSYCPNDVYAVATNTGRTKMSLELVLAGMYAPVGEIIEWSHGLNWQHIPFDVLSNEDAVGLFPLEHCSQYFEQYSKYYASDFGISFKKKYAKLNHLAEKETGTKNLNFVDLGRLYSIFQVDREWGFQLPKWIEQNMKNLKRAYIDVYTFSANFPKLNTLSGGFLLKKIMKELGDKVIISSKPKMHLFSAHDSTISYLMSVLGVYYSHFPNYGACFLIELHKINGVYGVKMFYLQSVGTERTPIRIPKCGYFCNLEKFIRLYQYSIPKDDACDIN